MLIFPPCDRNERHLRARHDSRPQLRPSRRYNLPTAGADAILWKPLHICGMQLRVLGRHRPAASAG